MLYENKSMAQTRILYLGLLDKFVYKGKIALLNYGHLDCEITT